MIIAATTMVLATGMLTACGSGPSEDSDIDTSGVTAPILDTLDGDEKARVAALIAQAQEEGGLNWIGSNVTTSKEPLVNEFKELYNLPDLEVTFENLPTADMTARVQGEVQAARIQTDFISIPGAPSFFSALKDANALLEYESPALADYEGTDEYLSDDWGYWVSPAGFMFLPIYNPALTDEIDSWYDLIDPAFTGKLSLPGVLSSESAAYTYWGLRSVLPTSYFEDLAALQPLVGVGKSAEATEKVASGELAVAVTSSVTAWRTSEQLGVPLAVAFPKEGAVMISWTLGILANSPHPATAQLFMDYILSQSAQQILTENEQLTPARNDVSVPAEMAATVATSLKEANALKVDSAVSAEEIEKARAEFEGIFG